MGFWGTEVDGNYCTYADTAEKEDAFSESGADFEMIPYLYTSYVSAYIFRAPTLPVPWVYTCNLPAKASVNYF